MTTRSLYKSNVGERNQTAVVLQRAESDNFERQTFNQTPNTTRLHHEYSAGSTEFRRSSHDGYRIDGGQPSAVDISPARRQGSRGHRLDADEVDDRVGARRWNSGRRF